MDIDNTDTDNTENSEIEKKSRHQNECGSAQTYKRLFTLKNIENSVNRIQAVNYSHIMTNFGSCDRKEGKL